ncbi:hypothetical protein DFQ26_006405 [Actinomortierella ambigua]|nr:hypothetical protein DFQ26_006405 [Actinomortierella ambigua]
MATDPLKQRVHFLAMPDRSNLPQLLQWDLPWTSTSTLTDCTCLSTFELETYLHKHWSAEQFHLPVPPGLTPIYTGLTLSTWDDVVPVYVQQTDQETLQAMVLLGQQGHCKVFMILRAETAVEDEDEVETGEEKDGGKGTSPKLNQQQDKHFLGGDKGREPTLCPSSTQWLNSDLAQSLPLSTPCRTSNGGCSGSGNGANSNSPSTSTSKGPPVVRSIWKYHDIRVHHDPSEAWVSNLTKAWDLISDNATCTTATTAATAADTTSTCMTSVAHVQKETTRANHDHGREGGEDEDDDDDDYWGQYGDGEEEASSGDSNNLDQDQACLDDLSSSTSTSSEATEEDDGSDSDDDYWGQYGDSDHPSDSSNNGGKSTTSATSSSSDHTDPSSTAAVAAACSVDDGASYPLTASALRQQLEEEQIKARQLRSDSLSTQVDPTMLSSILQMLASDSLGSLEDSDHNVMVDLVEQDQELQHTDQGRGQDIRYQELDHREGEAQEDVRPLHAGIQEEDSPLSVLTSPSHASSRKMQVQEENKLRPGSASPSPSVSAGLSSLQVVTTTTSTNNANTNTTTTTTHHFTPHSSHPMHHHPASHAGSDHAREPLSPTSISNSPSYPTYCQIPLVEDNNDHKQQLHTSMDDLVQLACRAGYTKHQLLQLIDQQFSAHERACQH